LIIIFIYYFIKTLIIFFYIFNQWTSTSYHRPGVKYLILCNEEDINKDKNERKLLTLWHVSVVKVLYSATFILIAFPVWYNQQKEKGETFCFRLDSVGWYYTII